MRALLLLLVLACAFALAAVWQRHHVSELRAARDAAEAAPASAVTAQDQPALAPGEALLIVGRPSGAEPRPRPADPAPPTKSAAVNETALADFTQEVQSGQTLSGIAHVHYGQSGPALVRALASYNGLDDPNQLRAGQTLLLPPIERLKGN